MLSVVRTRRVTEAVCLTTTQVGVRVAESPVMEEKSTFCQSSHEQREQRGLSARGNCRWRKKQCGLFIKYVFAWGFWGGTGLLQHMHASRASTRTTFWYCNLHSWNPLPLVATSSLLRTIYIRRIFRKSVFFVFFRTVFIYGKCEGCWRTIKTWLWSTLFLTPWTLYCWKWRSLMHYTSVKHCGDCRAFGGIASEGVYDSDVCEYKCTNAEAHSVSFLSSTETYMISRHDTSWYFTVIQRNEI